MPVAIQHAQGSVEQGRNHTVYQYIPCTQYPALTTVIFDRQNRHLKAELNFFPRVGPHSTQCKPRFSLSGSDYWSEYYGAPRGYYFPLYPPRRVLPVFKMLPAWKRRSTFYNSRPRRDLVTYFLEDMKNSEFSKSSSIKEKKEKKRKKQ